MFERRVPGLRAALAATVAAVAVTTGAGSAVAAPEADPMVAPVFHLYGVHKQTRDLWEWRHDGPHLTSDLALPADQSHLADIITVDNDNDGYGEARWTLYKDGRLDFVGMIDGSWHSAKTVGKGWNVYPEVLSPGNLGGAGQADLIGRDTAGVLWSYLSYPDGRLTTRTRVGGGWNAYDQLAGQGDLTGDGRADIVARDRTGVLWLYKGTGDYKAPFAARTRIGGGWNAYDRLLSLGDDNQDGKVDLLARKTTGEVLSYAGTGDAAKPFKAPVPYMGAYMKNFNLL
ncbi:FG-GAP repeat domain-containing protein [Streptomyces sp. NRRL F-5727]|uniref:FG-GAP repeat domain-containing protein n=1 Tax=Streptomyces sp. NRRL F-5727 TaxID=1463871 RepID=UPI0004C7085E|nr:VCBS repeat-containing protein [Streptomyces sp. NRRL F-5727]